MIKYTHLELNKDIAAPSGYYTPQKEVRLKYDGREVLYVLSQAVIESSCCGASDFNSALVPGFIVKWRGEKNKEGQPVSKVESISDETVRDAVRRHIKETEHITRVEFW
ncbi:MAG: hypothetical protein A2Y92_05755 [Chloroflexi bacterium RBG_13_57_8]|nr:MAG: hypothetical protein A2Y92_05755 [Chloroflexi bacterium RBG_13_57_8]